MALTSENIKQVIEAACSLNINANPKKIENFFGDVLGLNAVQLAAAFPDPDPVGIGAIAIGHVTRARENLLRDKGQMPTFVIFQEKMGAQTFISGIAAYLTHKNLLNDHPDDFLNRLATHKTIRSQLLKIDNGHKMELVAAAILSSACYYGEATRGSGDQGIDAVAWKHLIPIEGAFLDGELSENAIRPGTRAMVVASCKSAIGSNPTKLKVINPAHIRELVGSWLIQRSESGLWRNLGIQMLTPLQLVLVTTYRLSEESKAECQRLGIQTWGIPELIYLICRHAPPEVFPKKGTPTFSAAKFTMWWENKGSTRLSAQHI